MEKDRSQDIRDRAFRLACGVASVALAIEATPGRRCIVEQLLRSGTGIGANLEEAKAGSSKREFLRYVQISLREARETLYWLRICLALRLAPVPELRDLAGEAEQVSRILGAIVVKAKWQMTSRSTAFAFCIFTFALLPV